MMVIELARHKKVYEIINVVGFENLEAMSKILLCEFCSIIPIYKRQRGGRRVLVFSFCLSCVTNE